MEFLKSEGWKKMNGGGYYNIDKQLKVCTKCNKIHPFSNFNKNISNKTLGLDALCKTCQSISRGFIPRKERNSIVMKKCSGGCGELVEARAGMHTKLCLKCNRKQSSSDTANLTNKYVRRAIRAGYTRRHKTRFDLDIPEELVIIKRNVIAIKRLIKFKTDKMKKSTKNVKELVSVVKGAFKPIQYDQFHDAKKLNKILMSTLEKLTEEEPSITVGEAMAVAKIADTMVKNTLVELKKQQVASLITHVGVSSKVIDV